VKISLQASFDEAIHSGTVVNEHQRTRPCPPTLSNGGQRGRKCLCMTASLVMSWFIKIDMKQNHCSYSPTQKIRMVFYNFCFYFWVQHCCWTCLSSTLLLNMFEFNIAAEHVW